MEAVSWVVKARVAALVLLVGAAIGLGFFYGFVRSFIAVAVAAAIVQFGGRYIQTVVSSPRPATVTPVGEQDLRYVCTMCGLELKVTSATRGKPPTHCMEPMVLVPGPERDKG